MKFDLFVAGLLSVGVVSCHGHDHRDDDDDDRRGHRHGHHRRGHHLHGLNFQRSCFVDYFEDQDDFVTPSAQDLVKDCELELNQICGDQVNALKGESTLAASFDLQKCVNSNFYLISSSCKSSLKSNGMLDGQKLVPDVFRNRSVRMEAIDECRDDAHELCEDETEDFHPMNLCKVYEVGVCLQSQIDQVSDECKLALEPLQLNVPVDYNRETFGEQFVVDDSFAKIHHRHCVFGIIGAVLSVLLTIFVLKLGIRKYRQYKLNKSQKCTPTLPVDGVDVVKVHEESENPSQYKIMTNA